MAHYNQPPKNPPWVRNNVQQQPILAQQMTVQSVALSQPTIATTHITPQNSIGQVQITPAIQSHQVQLPVQHLLLNPAQAFGQQVQLANIATSQQTASTHQTYFTPSISLQQNVGLPQGTIQLQPSSLVIPSSVATSIAPPGLAITTTLATVHPNTTATYTINRLAVAPPQVHQQQPTVKQRVFSGIVTKLHENFGFIDEDVIFQSSVVKGTTPQVGDRVLVEASFNGSMPFKWNATRVQVIAQKSVSEPSKQTSRDWNIRPREPDRSTPKSREARRKSRSRSPPRRTRRYSVQIPKVSLDCKEANLIELRRRYSHLYIPSDFISCTNHWLDSFPMRHPLPIGKQVDFHVFDKGSDSPFENGAILEPEDADYSFSAKVMLASLPPIEEFMKKCCPDEESDNFVHPARLIRFLVGQRGKNETMAIGGPWSASLDGQDPSGNHQTLVKTAIRTCRALTGIDLSVCTRWYRVTEIRYRRKDRTETVVIFVPDVWSAVPTRGQWEDIVRSYVLQSAANDQKVTDSEQIKTEIEESDKQAAHFLKLNLKNHSEEELKSELEARNLNAQGDKWTLLSRLAIAKKCEAEDGRKKREEASENESESQSNSTEESDDKFEFAANPKILVHPSKTFKGGKFNCAVVSLSVLLDYRLEDTKEHTFEVSLFSESFNEMLMRDFGLLVYESVVSEVQRKEAKKKEAEEDSDKGKKNTLKVARLMINSNVPPLLAYSYFDLGRSNYVASKDLEDLFLTLGLQLSRAQVRKLLQKVVTDDNLRYRKLIEKIATRDNGELEDQKNPSAIDIPPECSDELLKDLTDSNQSAVNSSTNGCFVNVEQLIARLEQSEESRRQTEHQLKLTQQQLASCRSDLTKAEETIATLNEQLSIEKLKAEDAAKQLNNVQESYSKYSEAISKIQKLTKSLTSKTADDNQMDET